MAGQGDISMKTGVLHTIEANKLHLNGYKSEKEHTMTFGLKN